MECPHKTSCALFPLFQLKPSLRVWQTNYCEADFARCERHRRASVGEASPQNLLPNGKLLPVAPKPDAP